MTYVTEILADESGIQYQGVKDKTGGTGTYPITGLITGKFRRGRFDKPMTITNANIRAMLGYDPKNPSYTAVQDALNSGVPSVQVLRLKGSSSAFPNIPETDIQDHISWAGWFGLYWLSDIEWHLEVDGVLYKQTTPFGTQTGQGYYNNMDGSIHQIIIDHNLNFFDIFEDSSGNSGSLFLKEIGEKRIRFIPQSLTTDFPDKYPRYDAGSKPVIDPVTKIWAFKLRRTA